MGGREFAKQEPLKALSIILTDILFYILLYFIPIWSIYILGARVNRLPFQLAAMPSTVEEGQRYQQQVFKVLFSLIGSILLFFLLLVLAFAICKIIIWLLMEKKRATFLMLLKSSLLSLLLFFIFIIPLSLAISLFVPYAQANIQAPFTTYIPLLIVIFLMTYFSSLAYYYLAKTDSLKKAFSAFSFFKIPTKMLPYLLQYVAILLIYTFIKGYAWGLPLTALLIVGSSYFVRFSVLDQA